MELTRGLSGNWKATSKVSVEADFKHLVIFCVLPSHCLGVQAHIAELCREQSCDVLSLTALSSWVCAASSTLLSVYFR